MSLSPHPNVTLAEHGWQCLEVQALAHWFSRFSFAQPSALSCTISCAFSLFCMIHDTHLRLFTRLSSHSQDQSASTLGAQRCYNLRSVNNGHQRIIVRTFEAPSVHWRQWLSHHISSCSKNPRTRLMSFLRRSLAFTRQATEHHGLPGQTLSSLALLAGRRTIRDANSWSAGFISSRWRRSGPTVTL
jgi:hypothetical protein